MIYNIKIENFFSIADRQELALSVPDNTPALPCFVPSPSAKEVRLPTAVGIFGANASGKSTILRAIVATAMFGVFSVDWGADQLGTFFQPYRQKAWLKKPTI